MVLSPVKDIRNEMITYHEFFALRSLLWSIVVMVFQRIVGNDVVVHKGVSFRYVGLKYQGFSFG